MKGKFVVCSRRPKNVAGGSCTHASENFSRCSCAAHVKEIYQQELYGVKDHSTASAEFLFCFVAIFVVFADKLPNSKSASTCFASALLEYNSLPADVPIERA